MKQFYTVMHLKRGWKTHEPKSHRTSRETDKSIIIVGDANLSLSIVDKSSRLKIRRLQETWNQSTWPNWHWWNTLPKGSPRHTICTAISLHKFNRSQKSVFSDHNGIKIEINNIQISGKSPKYLETKPHNSKYKSKRKKMGKEW